MMVPVVAVLVVVSWVPMPTVTVVCALAGSAEISAAAVAATAEKRRYPGLRTIADLSVFDAPRACPRFSISFVDIADGANVVASKQSISCREKPECPALEQLGPKAPYP